MNKNETLPPLMITNQTTNSETKPSQPKPLSQRKLVMKSSISNAYNKSSLGTIPSSVSVLLYYDQTAETKKGFNSQLERFKSNRPLWKNSLLNQEVIPNKAQSSNLNPIQKSNENTNTNANPQTKATQLNINLSPRFDDKDLFISKHMPGPGEYNITNDNKDKSNQRYKSLFFSPSSPISQKNSSLLGPGSYNIDPIPQHNSKFFMSSLSRGNIHSYKDKIPGPGTYNLAPISIKKSNNDPSFFFKDKELQPVDLVEKYLNTQSSLNCISPGPGLGSYDVFYSHRNKPNANGNGTMANATMTNRKQAYKYFADIKTEIQQTINDEYLKVTNQQTENNFDNSQNKTKRRAMLRALYDPSHFHQMHYSISNDKKSSKDNINTSNGNGNSLNNNKNHIPGPCYYSPIISIRKKYNKNKQNNWL